MKRTLKTLSMITLLAASLLANVAWAQNGNLQLVNVFFTNQSNEAANVEWVNGANRQYYLTVPPGETRTLQTYIGNQWSFSGSQSAMGGPVTQANQVYTLQGPARVPQQIVPNIPRQWTPQPQGVATATSSVNQAVVNYAHSAVGQWIGNGQCTELAVAALRAAGARPNQGYTWGTRLNNLNEVQPGDILQMYDARFATNWSNGPHTAIVVAVQGNVIHVLEQNISGSRVQPGQYDMSTMTAGRMEYYRPVADNRGRGQGNPYAGPRPYREPTGPYAPRNETPWIQLIHAIID